MSYGPTRKHFRDQQWPVKDRQQPKRGRSKSYSTTDFDGNEAVNEEEP